MRPGDPTRRSPRVTVVATVLVFGAALGVLRERPRLAAAQPPQNPCGESNVDSDQDGLVDLLETAIGTNPHRADSDFDGYSDAEELARATSPTRVIDRPGGRRLSVGMTVFGQEGMLHAVTALYVEGGDLGSINFTLGARMGSQLRPFPASWWNTQARTLVVPARDSRDLVYLIDYPFSPQLVHGLGSLSVYSIVGGHETEAAASAAAINLVSATDGVVVQVRPPDTFWSEMGLQTSGQSNPGGAFGPAGSIYAPIPVDTNEEGGDNLPSTWTPAQVCAQRSTVVGASGAVTTHEVVQAECVEDLDSYCDPGCSATVGSTYQTVDPLVLVGG